MAGSVDLCSKGSEGEGEASPYPRFPRGPAANEKECRGRLCAHEGGTVRRQRYAAGERVERQQTGGICTMYRLCWVKSDSSGQLS